MNPLLTIAIFVIGFIPGMFVGYKIVIYGIRQALVNDQFRIKALHKCSDGHLHVAFSVANSDVIEAVMLDERSGAARDT